MSHVHDVFDTDNRFVIDPITRAISQQSGKTKLMQYDHNSERFAFEIPRHIEGHDMSLCNDVRVHYLNLSSNRQSQSNGPYVVTDMQVDPEDNDKVILSWLISRGSTTYAGTLNFNIAFRCLSGSIVDYSWNTDVFKGITISAGVDDEDPTQDEEYVDILEQWKQDVLANLDISSGTVTSVNGIEPDENGNVEVPCEGTVTSVNGIEPDENGNVEISFGKTVMSVNGIKPDANGNVKVSSEMPSPWDIPSDDGDLMPYDKILSVGMGDDLEPAWVLTKPLGIEAVRFTKQTLNLNQQAQARENIGAADMDSLNEVFEDIDDLRANAGGNSVIGVIDSHYYNFRFLNEERGATMAQIREAAQTKDKDIIIRLDLDNWQGTLHYLGLVNLTDDGSTYKEALLFTTIKTNNGVINTSDNIITGTMQLEYWYTLLDPGDSMPPVAFVNCQFAEINLAPGSSHVGSFMRVNDDGMWDVEKVDIIQPPTTAEVGQVLVVKTVDENGKPTEWETVDSIGSNNADSLTLTDKVTGVKYSLEVTNGTVTLMEVTE